MDIHNNVTVGALLSLEGYIIIQNINAYTGLILSVFGTIANIINIKTFLAIGIHDGYIVSFLSLAIVDLLTSIITFGISIALVLHVVEISTLNAFSHDPLMLAIIFVDIGFMTYLVTVLTTMYIAVERCLCVSRPLQFKNMFSRSRSICILTSFYIFAIVVFIPLFANQEIRKQFSLSCNCTRYVLWFTPERAQVKDDIFLVSQSIIPFITEFVTIVCAVIMFRMLRESSRFRYLATCRSRSYQIPNNERMEYSPKTVHEPTNVGEHTTSNYEACQTNDISSPDKLKESRRNSMGKTQSLILTAVGNSYAQGNCTSETQANDQISNIGNSTDNTSPKRWHTSRRVKENVQNEEHHNDDTKCNSSNNVHTISKQGKRSNVSLIQSSTNGISAISWSELGRRNAKLTEGVSSYISEEDLTERHSLSGTDLQLVNQVILICVIFIFLNTPSIINGIINLLVSEYDINWEKDRYVHLYLASSFLRRILEQINATVNLFIYFKFNTKFRRYFCPKSVGMFLGRRMACG